ncbi:MAG: hypothetical protein P8R54_29020 [Myxococcota bacterium]|nr:hypothetical protein [Myxococcota bacterium]
MVRALTAAVLLTGCDEVGLDSLGSALIGPVLEVEPVGDLTFGGTSLTGSGSTETLTLYSSGDEELVLLSIDFHEDTPLAFSLPSGIPVPGMLQPGDSLPINISFQPDELGGYNGWVVVMVEGEDGSLELSRRIVGQGCDPEYATGDCS